MIVRIASALVASVVLLTAAAAGGWWFGSFALLVIAVGLNEFFAMVVPEDRFARVAGIVLGLLLALAVFTGFARGEQGLLIFTLAVMIPVVGRLFRNQPIETAALHMSLSVTGLLWVAGLGAITASLVLLEQGFSWIVLAGVLSFGSDAGGYFVGRFFGRHKLYETVSPKKTWEGAIGGVLTATLLSLAVCRWWGPSIPWCQIMLFAPLASAFGQLGDLAESLLKRSMGVKDSGDIMPGHGGVLDRIDALLFVGPPLFFFARLGLGVEVRWLEIW